MSDKRRRKHNRYENSGGADTKNSQSGVHAFIFCFGGDDSLLASLAVKSDRKMAETFRGVAAHPLCKSFDHRACQDLRRDGASP
jgi:hypothetical protein